MVESGHLGNLVCVGCVFLGLGIFFCKNNSILKQPSLVNTVAHDARAYDAVVSNACVVDVRMVGAAIIAASKHILIQVSGLLSPYNCCRDIEIREFASVRTVHSGVFSG